MTSYHEFNKIDKAAYLVEQMKTGVNIALVTDAGTPGISDPGKSLCASAARQESRSLPPRSLRLYNGSYIVRMSTRRFCFEAFLPADKKERQRILEELKEETRTIILYEAPHRLVKTLSELKEALGDRRLTLCRELTKKYEEAWHTTVEEALERYEKEEPRGECVMVIEGKSFQEKQAQERETWETMSIEDHVAYYESQGMERKEAMRRAAKDRGISKRDVYQHLIEK